MKLGAGGAAANYSEGAYSAGSYGSATLGWTDVSADILEEPAPIFRYGIFGNRPKDRVASPGRLDFYLDNSEFNSGGVRGYYTPGHASKRSNFREGIGIRVKITYGGTAYYKWMGRLKKITPDAGKFGKNRVRCRATDWMADAADARPEFLTVQTNKKGHELLSTAIASLDQQPTDTDLQTGVSTFAYAFDEIRDGQTTMLQIIKNVTLSELGYAAVIGDTTAGGKFTFWPRTARELDTNVIVRMDGDGDSDDFRNISAVDDEDLIFNDIQITTRPRVVDEFSSDQVLFTLQGDDPSIGAAESKTIIGRFTDPSNPDARIGGADIITPVEGTDYTFSGSDSDLAIVATLGGNSVKFVMTNNSGSTGTVTKLQLRGKRVLTYEPAISLQTDSDSIAIYNTKPLRLQLPYQDNPLEAQDFVDTLIGRWKDPKVRVKTVSFDPNQGDSLMTAALVGEPGRRIGISDPVTGVTDDYVIGGVEMTLAKGKLIPTTWFLQLASDSTFWILGTSKLDTETILGF